MLPLLMGYTHMCATGEWVPPPSVSFYTTASTIVKLNYLQVATILFAHAHLLSLWNVLVANTQLV